MFEIERNNRTIVDFFFFNFILFTSNRGIFYFSDLCSSHGHGTIIYIAHENLIFTVLDIWCAPLVILSIPILAPSSHLLCGESTVHIFVKNCNGCSAGKPVSLDDTETLFKQLLYQLFNCDSTTLHVIIGTVIIAIVFCDVTRARHKQWHR